MTGIDEHVDDVRAAGFVNVVATDDPPMGALRAPRDWRRGRRTTRAYAHAHGEAAYAAQELFYAVIVRLFDSGSMGGVRLVAQVPCDADGDP